MITVLIGRHQKACRLAIPLHKSTKKSCEHIESRWQPPGHEKSPLNPTCWHLDLAFLASITDHDFLWLKLPAGGGSLQQVKRSDMVL